MASAGDYSPLDRLLHHISFSTPFVQKVLCEIENDIFASRLKNVVSRREVFITGLPRSGTTLVLNLLYGTDEFASFTYRQMPFVLSPLLWARLSQLFRKPTQKMERAHGDGMEVSFDSPEAFEEIIWLAYLKKKIVGETFLSPLDPEDCSQEFADAFQLAIRKLIYLDGVSRPIGSQRRYLSKNNANISRLRLILALCPEATVIVPFRHPIAHVGSLMRQHELFIRRHKADKFAKRYMRWLGHYEFGDNFRPINFAGWLEDADAVRVVDQTFWLRYWTVAYTFVQQTCTDNVLFLDFDDLLQNGVTSLQRIAECTALGKTSGLTGQAGLLRSPTTVPPEKEIFKEHDLQAALSTYSKLKARAL